MTTDQEAAWAGEFGAQYHQRNADSKQVQRNARDFFYRILAPRAWSFETILELGAGVGVNLAALRTLLPKAKLHGVEISELAYTQLKKVADIAVHASLLNFRVPLPSFDLVFTKGVLIHVVPRDLGQAYDVLHSCSRRYILIAEYYNPTPLMVAYRGYDNLLCKRDFAGELLERHRDLRLVDYGFVYHRDAFPQDDLTWFLLEKTEGRQ